MQKCSEFNQNHLSYQEPQRSQVEWKKTSNRCQHQEERDVKIIWQRFLKQPW